MKITKEYLKRIIKEELGRMEEMSYGIDHAQSSMELKGKKVTSPNGKPAIVKSEFYNANTGEGGLDLSNEERITFNIIKSLTGRENTVSTNSKDPVVINYLKSKYANKGK